MSLPPQMALPKDVGVYPNGLSMTFSHHPHLLLPPQVALAAADLEQPTTAAGRQVGWG